MKKTFIIVLILLAFGFTNSTFAQTEAPATPTIELLNDQGLRGGASYTVEPSGSPSRTQIQSSETPTPLNVESGSISKVLKGCESGGCGFEHLIQLSNEIGKVVMALTTSAAVVMFVYAGFLYITAQGDSNQISRATNIFTNVAIGFVIILSAYLLVKEFLIKLGLPFLANLIS